MSFKHNSNLYAFTKKSNDPKAKADYIKSCKILYYCTSETQYLQ